MSPSKPSLTCALYIRVSTEDQEYEDQLAALRDYAKRQGWAALEYIEKLSGKEGVRRPVLDRLLKDAQNKRFDVVVVWKLDRFGRSALDTLENIKKLDAFGIRFLCESQPAIDTDDRTPLGKFILTILAAVAELERSFIIERTQTGFKSYRAAHAAGRVGKGKTRHSKSGKDLPVGRPRAVVDKVRVKEMRAAGLSIREISKALGVGRDTVHQMVKSLSE
jgi:putative DNA-invertase from lambdoid prophage Rac